MIFWISKKKLETYLLGDSSDFLISTILHPTLFVSESDSYFFKQVGIQSGLDLDLQKNRNLNFSDGEILIFLSIFLTTLTLGGMYVC